MRLAHLLNTLARFSKNLAKLFCELGVQATIEFIRNTLTGPWLNVHELKGLLYGAVGFPGCSRQGGRSNLSHRMSVTTASNRLHRIVEPWVIRGVPQEFVRICSGAEGKVKVAPPENADNSIKEALVWKPAI